MKIRAVAFDLDGTLYPASALNRRAAGLCLRHPALFAAFTKLRHDLRFLAMTEEYRKNPPADGREFRAMESHVLSLRMRRPEDEIKSLVGELFYDRVFECFSRISPFPGVREALSSFRNTGLPIGLLSDMPPDRKLELMGLSECFDIVLCSEDSGFLKPESVSFLKLARALNRDPAEILYVGNNPRYDLAGAHKAGMMAAIVTKRRIPDADLCFFHWNDLVRFVLEHL